MNNFVDRMLQMVNEGGNISLSHIEDSAPTLKPDQSVLTKADLAVSKFIKEQMKDLLDSGEHLLIEEEDQQSERYFDQKVLESVPYVWSVDPIDGTRSYSNRMPMFGISIGVFKDLKPWLGVVYFPAWKELFYCDGERAFFVKNAFTSQEKKTEVVPIDQDITKQSIFFSSDVLFQYYDWDFSFCQIMAPSCAVIDLCWPAIGRGCGCFLKASLWDFAGSWPIVKVAGLDLRSAVSGEKLDRLHVDLFMGEGSQTWKLAQFYILSSEKNYPIIKSKMTAK